MELTPWDQYQWETFHDAHPRWNLLEYGDRVTIGNGRYEINAVSMEKAIDTAKRQLKWDWERYRYHSGCGLAYGWYI